MKRQPLKRTNSTLKKGGPIRRKEPSHHQVAMRKAESEKMWELFEEHWQLKQVNGRRICEGCGVALWGENKSLYHDHLIEKSQYPEYKYDINNLFLCCGDCHTKKTNGFPVAAHEEAIRRIKEKYGMI